MNYQDDLDFLQSFANESFPIVTYFDGLTEDEFRQGNTKHWAACYVLFKCYDSMDKDPLEILEDESSMYQIESMFNFQKLNKKNYESATSAIEVMREALLKRRGITYE